MAVDVQRQALLRVPELRGEVRHRDAFGDLHRGLTVPQIVRVQLDLLNQFLAQIESAANDPYG
jgi:hypothetical protein